eukprot:CAMPEP_0114249688 /NCGR_PEP_ID=MMETSP0058-20121206/14286_1 /TAXON_ID=36894 /ORGANISM="Pyramimonas parkeae, CCMP726" /LENGTH=164 /DNA_ID=CAMNT_0001363271 /DNA_START=365 /DNA_END=859 /DNA_ORIENTATION=+
MGVLRKNWTDEQLAGEWPYLTRAQVRDFKDAFSIFDNDKGGTITTKELFEVMKALDQNPTIAEVEAMVSGMDLDGNGVIDFPEFLLLILRSMAEGNSEQELKEMFQLFDNDKSGTLSADELRKAMRMIGEQLTDEEVEDAIKLADFSDDGNVDYDEFIQFVLMD